MRTVIALVVFSFLALVPIGISAPIAGVSSDHGEVATEGWKKTLRLRGGERACIIAVGDHGDVKNLHVTIHDDKGTLVAEDKGNSSIVSDYVAVLFYPPRDGDYRIDVKHPGPGTNKIYIAVK